MELTRFAAVWDDLEAEGVVTFTATEVVGQTGSSLASVYKALSQAQRRNRLFSPTRGLYVLVPLEYRDWGAPPVEWFIDDLCRRVHRRYYVGYLSAAAYHGAAHQAAQLTQIVVDRTVQMKLTRPRRVDFHASSTFESHATQLAHSAGGAYRVATPETLALDLAESPIRGAGLNNVATILRDLSLDIEAMLGPASARSRATVRRLGYLLQRAAGMPDQELLGLRRIARPEEGAKTRLTAHGTWGGDIDLRWGIIANTPVEADE